MAQMDLPLQISVGFPPALNTVDRPTLLSCANHPPPTPQSTGNSPSVWAICLLREAGASMRVRLGLRGAHHKEVHSAGRQEARLHPGNLEALQGNLAGHQGRRADREWLALSLHLTCAAVLQWVVLVARRWVVMVARRWVALVARR